MKKILFISVLFLAVFAFTFSVFASENNSEEAPVFSIVEVMPEFPGGNLAMLKFIAENLIYPIESMRRGESGRVIVQFIVEPNGEVSNVQVARGLSPALDREAILVVESLPAWTPGKHQGEKVRARMTVPVMFHPVEVVEDIVIIDVDKQPEFPGGEDALRQFMSNNLRFPVIAVENWEQGTVLVQFVVRHTGEITDVTVIQSVSPPLDREAVRLIESMPNWIPGEFDGERVSSPFTLPVTFRLEGAPPRMPQSRQVETRRNRQR